MTELSLHSLRDLDDDALAAAYAPRAEPWLRVNFVSSVDGTSQGGDGLSKSINNDADKRVFDALRTQADCLVVGAGTLRSEGYDVPRLPLVVVSRKAEVPEKLREAPYGRILMATVASAEHLDATRSLLGEENTLVLGDDEIDFAALKSTLADRGWVDQLCEGGPQLFGTMVEAGVVDELCHTVVPRLLGGDGLRIMTGPDVDVALEPILLLQQDGTILGRWLIS
ncbi:dihydrofolate reductase family protein [Nocardioides currus]|uniref:Pyrimidine reductase family protein n=1 Tax=Nocardioides currus TaxID=2133958 RepID=A0A2R7YYT4_9ACTN|nr:dihydrofolate reductase family protein [Nocardioides currus]PUA81511.1 pyrimidine reductase family protein [Nocardioides currus]